MKILNYKTIDYSEVQSNELYDTRIDSDYYDPFYISNAKIIERKACKQIKDFMSSPQYGISVAMNELKDGYIMLKMDDIIGVYANDETAKYANIPEKLFKQFKLNKFDVLFNRVNSDEFVGRTGIYLLDGDHTFASYLVRISSDFTYQNCYLTIFLNCIYGYHSFQRVKRRAVNQANINARELKNLTIPFPSETFQKKIEKIVIDSFELINNSAINFKIATNIILRELDLDSWKPPLVDYSIGHATFQTVDTANEILLSKTLAHNRIDSEYWQSYLTELENKIKSYSNRIEQLGDICKIYNSNYYPELETEYKYIELSNIGVFGNILGFTKDYGKNLPTRARRLIRTNQVIVSSIEGSLDSCALITADYNNCICSNGFYVIDSELINSETLITLLKSLPFQYLLKKGCTGTILTSINDHFFRRLVIPKLRYSVQKEIKKIIKGMYKMKRISDELIEIAKKSVEIFIEQDESIAIKFMDNELKTVFK